MKLSQNFHFQKQIPENWKRWGIENEVKLDGENMNTSNMEKRRKSNSMTPINCSKI